MAEEKTKAGLLVEITGKADALKAELDKVGHGLSGLTNSFKSLLSPASILESLLGVAIVSAMEKAMDATQEYTLGVKRMAETNDLSYDSTVALQQAAEKLGVGTEGVNTAMFRLSMEMEMGGKHLKTLGISLRDNEGNLKSQGDLFMEARSKISKMTDAQQQNNAARALFGRQAKELMPIMRASDDLLKEEGEDAVKLGLNITKADIDRAAAFRAAKTDLADMGLAANVKFGKPLQEAFINFVETAKQAQKDIDGIIKSLDRLAAQILSLGHATTLYAKTVTKEPDPVVEMWKKRAAAALEKSAELQTAADKAAIAYIAALEKSGAIQKKAIETTQKGVTEEQAWEKDARLKAAADSAAALSKQFDNEKAIVDLSYEEQKTAAKDSTTALAEIERNHADQIIGIATAQGDAEIAEIRRKVREKIITVEQGAADEQAVVIKTNKSTADANKIVRDAEEKASVTAFGKMGAIMDTYMKGTLSKTTAFAKTRQILTTAETIMSANTAAAAAAESVALTPIVGPALALAARAMVYADIIASVAEIAGVTFAQAGEWKVPGAAGAGDTKPYMLSPGEMVLSSGIAEAVRGRMGAGGPAAAGGINMGGVNINVSGTISSDMDIRTVSEKIFDHFMGNLRDSGVRI